MRNGIGICLLFALIFGGFWPVSVPAFALFVSALIAYILPGSKIGLPGTLAATALGSLAMLILLVVGIDGFIDRDC